MELKERDKKRDGVKKEEEKNAIQKRENLKKSEREQRKVRDKERPK